MFKKLIVPIFYTALFSSAAFGQIATSTSKVKLQLVTDQLSHPTAFAVTTKSPELLFVCEQEGKIRIIQNGKLAATPFLDITKEVLKKDGYDERGLLGLAFHPDYATNGKFYVYMSVAAVPDEKGVNHRSEVREYIVDKGNPLTANKSSMRKVLVFDQPESNHNGGDLKFGTDGFLYISAGDGGGADDKHGQYGNAQNLSNLLGKILRIDVNNTPYSIPADNPFVKTQDAKGEIYAYGLRNPWRFSFDRNTKQLFAGDVGQNKYEEVDVITKGGNYGWRPIEGLHDFRSDDPKPVNPIATIAEYPHPEGLSITGGFVYRGKAIPSLAGKYIFGDMMGPIWSLTPGANDKWTREKLSIGKDAGYWHVYSFGEDLSGELYVLTVLLDSNKGALYKLVP
ncbi:Glucose/arabinose dehydrogenase, beta-propeller fold [Dyadobacter koreensis]|uniref:Glucose/arabinose dehydrogenase, beta-propeller fold n=1 Tax=Dyadobacter koreensis TaxID=408657 RepID=A0A1H6UZW1_9BACT|nr:PQQ-dependent sugar dehydrogenase [Dyadobacter koreensis]SEI93552.1 Glucose/arabinose dehydrogenase, beta-propeller fold [Dyadobacter koreensis]